MALAQDLTFKLFQERMTALEKDRGHETRDKPIYVRAHVSFVAAYWRKAPPNWKHRASKPKRPHKPSLRLVRRFANA